MTEENLSKQTKKEQWIQTSTEDLFSLKEITDIIQNIEKDKNSEEVVLAKIDFQKVDKEYYAEIQELKEKLVEREKQMNLVIKKANNEINLRNEKLKEMIDYTKSLHQLLKYAEFKGEEFTKNKRLTFNLREYFAQSEDFQDNMVFRASKRRPYTITEEILVDSQSKETDDVIGITSK